MDKLEPVGVGPDIYGRLDEFLECLRDDGIVCEPHQRVLLIGLLSRLEAARERVSASTLAGRIIPILAGTPAQQALCHNRFQELFLPSDVRVPAQKTFQSKKSIAEEEQETQRRWGLQTSFASAVALVSMVAFVLGASILVYRYGLPYWQGTTPAAVRAEPQSSGTISNIPDWIREFPIKELAPPEQSPWNRTWRWYYTEYDWRKWLAAGLPWALYLAAIGMLIYLTLAHLRRESLKQNLKSLPWRFRGDPLKFGDRGLIADLQPLRLLPRDVVRELDPKATIQATMEKGGMLTPRFRSKPVPVDFVALIDRRSGRDHLASFGETIVDTLRSAGLFVEQLDFDRSPWICRRNRTGEVESLDDIVASFSDSVVLLFSSEQQLVHPATGAPQDWVHTLRNIPRRFLVVPSVNVSIEADAVASDLGFHALPMSPDGLRSFAFQLLNTSNGGNDRQGTPAVRAADVASKLAGVLEWINDRPDRWMQNAPLPKAEIEGLLKRLRHATGPSGYRWIAATSVYPELRWPITVHLKKAMRSSGGVEGTLDGALLGISQFPWFRRGWMPDWLREALLNELPANRRRFIRDRLLEAMGIKPRNDLASEQLDISLSEKRNLLSTHQVRADRLLLDYLLPTLNPRHQLFALPESWARRLAKKPVRRLVIASAAGAGIAFTGSIAALSYVPIKDCDLYASSGSDPLRVGAGVRYAAYVNGGWGRLALSACEKALEADPNNPRLLYQYGRVAMDYEELQASITALKRSSDLGYAAATHALGWVYRQKPSVKNIPLSIEYAEKAIEQGTIESHFSLGYIYSGDVDETYRDNDKSLFHYREYLRLGGDWLTNYAYAYKDGELGLDPDHDKYLEILKLGLSRGDAHAAADIASEINEGTFGTPDKKRVFDLYQFAVNEGGSGFAAWQLAELYFRGDGVEKDDDAALYWSIFAARSGEDRAMPLVESIVGAGNLGGVSRYGIKRSVLIAKLRSVANTENSPASAQYYLGLFLQGDGRIDEAKKWYEKSAAKGYQKALDALERLN